MAEEQGKPAIEHGLVVYDEKYVKLPIVAFVHPSAGIGPNTAKAEEGAEETPGFNATYHQCPHCGRIIMSGFTSCIHVGCGAIFFMKERRSGACFSPVMASRYSECCNRVQQMLGSAANSLGSRETPTIEKVDQYQANLQRTVVYGDHQGKRSPFSVITAKVRDLWTWQMRWLTYDADFVHREAEKRLIPWTPSDRRGYNWDNVDRQSDNRTWPILEDWKKQGQDVTGEERTRLFLAAQVLNLSLIHI